MSTSIDTQKPTASHQSATCQQNQTHVDAMTKTSTAEERKISNNKIFDAERRAREGRAQVARNERASEKKGWGSGFLKFPGWS
jgi:hypothetical protein